MILSNRLFERQAPSREAKSVYIFCEGARREYQYFNYFREIDSRIKVEVNKLKSDENNSPKGLYELAENSFIGEKPKFTIQENDEIWIVLDTDPDKANSRAEQIKQVKEDCQSKGNWFVVESNPCFEVWLFFHQNEKFEAFDADDFCKGWKQKVGEQGGFDSRKHPIFIEEAIRNAERNYRTNENNRPLKGSSEVYLLAKSIFAVIKNKIRAAKNKL
ncbi:RloB-like protein [Flexibacter flexilis DSM 6793]|uniref:RloB-like protein n=1 Tax=Flexibacter flexilis DSM 6793 TaxID=927664 RepID=A0A1I1DHW2_9BACT|nr:RloB family protein [Flexibacter flexilis]SFB72638.1 RloB-like protein [Flexibacter flexilis DSM 6793]